MKVTRRRDTAPEIDPVHWAFLHFVPRGAPAFTVDLRNCPAGIPAFRHWRVDGTCCCDEATA